MEDGCEFLADFYVFLSHTLQNKTFCRLINENKDFLPKTIALY